MIKFCSQCGNPTRQQIPAGDNRERAVCPACDIVHYRNPRIIAGCLPVHKEKVLLCRRAIYPRKGFWTVPAGFMENGETTIEAAVRETREEACADVRIETLYTVTSIVPINQVQMLYLARLEQPVFAAGDESLEVRLFAEDEIPWNQLAFETIHSILAFFFADRQLGAYPLRHIDINTRAQDGTKTCPHPNDI